MPTSSHRRARRRGVILGATLSSRSSRKNKAATHSEAPIQTEQSTGTNTITAQLTELKSLLDQGILTQEEFDAKKRQILDI